DLDPDFDPDFDLDPASDRSGSGPEHADAAEDDRTWLPVDDRIDEGLVLHLLRVRGFVTPDGFAASLGHHPGDLLSELVHAGLVRHIEQRDMYGLLPPSKARQEELLEEYAGPEVRAALAAHYDRFLDLNDEFKRLCTDWQLRDGCPNDHSDADHDRACIARLVALADESGPIVTAMASAVPRLVRYTTPLAEAAAAAAHGDPRRFTGVMCESFHDVWMELHEDLIVLQRINRVAEGSF